MLKSNQMPAGMRGSRVPLNSGCTVLFALPFILGGLAVGWFLYFPMLNGWWAARGWEEVPCWIERSEIQSAVSKKSTTYRTEATFRYLYDGRTYRSSRVSLGDGGADNIGEFQRRAYAEIKAHEGKERPFRCYVNPEKPEEAVLFRDLRWGMLLMTSLFPTLFPLAGLMVALLGGGVARRAAYAGKLGARHPEEPWRWRREWEGEVIQESSRGLVVCLLLGGWLLVVQGPLAGAILASGEILRMPAAALGLLPLGLAGIPLLLAWRHVQTRRTLGRPGLWLKQRPITPGRVMDGELRFDRALPPLSTIEVRMLCEKQVTQRQGKGTSTTKEKIWEMKETLPAAEARREANGVALPLQIDIPGGLPCTLVETAEHTVSASEQHVWTLDVRSSQGGRPVSLVLPVFETSAERELAESARAAAEGLVEPTTQELQERLEKRHVMVEFDAEGMPTVIDCLPGRHRGLAVFLLIFGSVWALAFLVMLLSGAPVQFLLIWGVSSPLILGVGVMALLHRRRVVLDGDEMRVTTTAGAMFSGRVRLERRQLLGFSHDTNMQSGSQRYYRVLGDTIFGRKQILVTGITEAVTAEMLARRLERWRKGGGNGEGIGD